MLLPHIWIRETERNVERKVITKTLNREKYNKKKKKKDSSAIHKTYNDRLQITPTLATK